MKALKILGAAILALLAIAVIVLVIGIPGGFISNAIQSRVENETGYRIAISGSTRLALWPLPVLEMRDISLSDPNPRATSVALAIESVRADISVRSLLTGHPRLRDLTIVRPVATLPLLRERSRDTGASGNHALNIRSAGPSAFPIDHLTVTDGTVVFKNDRDRVESRIGAINLKALTSPDGQVDLTGDAKSGDQLIKFNVTATIPVGAIDGLTIPVDFKFDAPGLLPQPLSGAGDVKPNGAVIVINSLSGMFGTAKFGGYASFDLASKPSIKMDLDFQRLDLEAPAAVSAAAAARRPLDSSGATPAAVPINPWSDGDIDLSQLNYVDAQIRVSVATLNIGSVRLAPAKIESTLASGIMKMTLSDLGLYDGQAAAGFAVDASIPSPIYALRAEGRNVRALPLLTSLADFTSVDGKMQAALDVRTTGRSQRDLVANLIGTAAVTVADGQLRGLNVARMIRSLTSTTLSGWQDTATESTDLSMLGASFKIDKGQATTEDLKLFGPLVRLTGKGSLNLPTKSLAFRVEPKLVLTTEGQGGATDPIGLGIPVRIDGAWNAPRIYPDMAGMLDNPDAAFAKLRELGQGLFGALPAQPGAGKSNPASPDTSAGKLMEKLGPLVQGLGNGGLTGGNQKPTQDSNAPSAQTPPSGQTPANDDKDFPIDQIIRNLFGK